MLKATIIESSLADRNILRRLQAIQTRRAGSWVLHDVLLEQDQFSDLQRSLSRGPWYVHVWKPGLDDVYVVFKDKIFQIQFSDKASWVDAVAHGKSVGIPEEQLDFPID